MCALQLLINHPIKNPSAINRDVPASDESGHKQVKKRSACFNTAEPSQPQLYNHNKNKKRKKEENTQ